MNDQYVFPLPVLSLAYQLTEQLKGRGFQRFTLDEVCSTDREHLLQRDRRESIGCVGLTPNQRWRSDQDYLVYDNQQGTLAYLRSDPLAPYHCGALPFNIHLRTAAPRGLTVEQYFSLGLPQKNLVRLRDSLASNGNSEVTFISDLDQANVLRQIVSELDEIEGTDLPIRLFHSVYIGLREQSLVQQQKKDESSDPKNAITQLSKAIESVLVAVHLFSRKQIAYYQAAAEVDQQFQDSALVS